MKLFFFFLLFTSYSVFGQKNPYILYFNNKDIKIDPSNFLTLRSLERRISQGIDLNFTDFPVDQNYIQTLKNLNLEIIKPSKWLNGVFSYLTESEIFEVRKLPFISKITLVKPKKLIDLPKVEKSKTLESFEPSFYGAAYNQAHIIGADSLHKKGWTGKDQLIACFDVGFNNLNKNVAFKSVLEQNRIIKTWNFVKNKEDVYNEGDHGTMVMSNICAFLPNEMVGTGFDASFILASTEDGPNETIQEEYNWVLAAEWADSLGANIFTTSLGYTTFDDASQNHDYSTLDGDKSPITIAADLAAQKGIVVLNSAGNEGDKPWHYISCPADGDSVLAIGAVDSTRNRAFFSGNGPSFDGRIKPDVMGVGRNIAVVYPNGNVAISNGTSFSCPSMAGLVACLWQAFPNATADQIRESLKKSCDRFENPDNQYGYGIPNANLAFVELATIFNINALKIFPNPATNYFIIQKSGLEINTIYNIKIIDHLGKLVYNEQIKSEKSYINHKINLNINMSSGIYILCFGKNGDKKSEQIKIYIEE